MLSFRDIIGIISILNTIFIIFYFVGSASSIAQISEIDIFGKASTSASGKQLFGSSQSHSKHGKLGSDTIIFPADPSLSLNKPPDAKDDRIKTDVNKPVEIAILGNDKDPDGDKLKIMSVTSPSQNGGIVAINENGTVTFFPRNDNTGTDRFSYTVSDGEGNSDKARVSVIIKVTIDRTADKQSTLDSQGNEDGHEVKVQQKNEVNIIPSNELTRQQASQTGKGTNDTENDIR